MDITNRRFGNYRIVSRVGRGGFATIWKGESVSDRKEKVVVKLMLPEKAAYWHNRRMFSREWKICRRFDHPGVLKYFGCGTYEGLPYLIMEFFEGRTLKGLIFDKSPLVYDRTRDIILLITSALAHVHSFNVVHRDMKPENVMINTEGELRLIDFSLSQTKWQRFVSMSRRLSGSPSYLAPELLAGKPASARSDIYALGVIIYEIMTGRPPFIGIRAKEVMSQHMRSAPSRLSKLNPQVNHALEKLVASMLDKDPYGRPVDGAEALRRLEAIPVYLHPQAQPPAEGEVDDA
ncbi:MAG: serine/threonine protein kinase [Planctomycetes bacterium]|nr:serine/threonine protein kinase [Planctomycetota bacterium]